MIKNNYDKTKRNKGEREQGGTEGNRDKKGVNEEGRV
jgi:hypothetical protein